MKLSVLLEGVTVSKMFQTAYGRMVTTHDVEIKDIRTDSRSVDPGDLFVAIPGSAADGHAYTAEAIGKKARAIVVERDEAVSDAKCMHAGVVKVVVPHTRLALAQIAANFYERPATQLTMVGITGTNGKTTTASLIGSILKAGGENVATVGTLGVQFAGKQVPSSHTTPGAVELQRLLFSMRKENITAVSMEVSSHALDQLRVEGIPYTCAVFTNLTQDHLDYHATMDHYLAAKKTLFDGLPASSHAVVNADDPWTSQIIRDTKAHVLPFGRAHDSAVKLIQTNTGVDGSMLEVQFDEHTVSISSPLIGDFNVSNILAACAAGFALGIPVPAIELGIASLSNVKGRFERVRSEKGWTAIIDYAHTPDALSKCLKALHGLTGDTGRIITVFGAGGDRDKGKRPHMGKVAMELSDEVIVTSDNPRSEDPDAIISDIISGIRDRVHVTQEPDRRKAIATAVSMAHKDDIILIAGKGHEEVQILGNERRQFSDKEVIDSLL